MLPHFSKIRPTWCSGGRHPRNGGQLRTFALVPVQPFVVQGCVGCQLRCPHWTAVPMKTIVCFIPISTKLNEGRWHSFQAELTLGPHLSAAASPRRVCGIASVRAPFVPRIPLLESHELRGTLARREWDVFNL
ncbi:hypothetical protein JTE90_016779 [Oedothorax gibbosus]|uniref:Uncharacterized protein n=1 Tax=Oedothorax gibbosus TaxID=931172 RepID=A0AAV6VWH3_9ARAC|nr:hypothetical protein JTE90_016779 [Oedothorax gibbosus]